MARLIIPHSNRQKAQRAQGRDSPWTWIVTSRADTAGGVRGCRRRCLDGGVRGASAQAETRIEQLAPELDKIIATNEPIKELAAGFGGPLGPAEGPLWWKEGGYLLFSDIHNNRRMKYTPGQGVVRGPRADQSRQRADPRSAGPPALLRARHPPGDAARARRQPHRARATASRAGGSTGPTMSSSSPTARSISPIRGPARPRPSNGT